MFSSFPQLRTLCLAVTALSLTIINVAHSATSAPPSQAVLSWGGDMSGQLGDGVNLTDGSYPPSQPLPIDITQNGALSGKTLTQLTTTYEHNLALATDGSVSSWGRNYTSQLGDNTVNSSSLPIDITTKGVLKGKTVTKVVTSFTSSFALCSDGTVAVWGHNIHGELGTGDYTRRSVPTAITNNGALNGKTVVQIAAGAMHALALCSDGTLAIWGSNGAGQIGDGTGGNTFKLLPFDITHEGVLNGKTVTQISCGLYYNLVLCQDGSLIDWGSGPTPSTEPTNIAGMGALSGKTVVQLAAGGDYCLVLCSDGTVISWGNNDSGQLGNGSVDTTYTHNNVPVNISSNGALSGKKVIQLTAGDRHSLALCNDGTVASWGLNSSGQLGDGTTTNQPLPVDITGKGALLGKTVTSLAAGAYHTLALALVPDAPTIQINTPTLNQKVLIADFNSKFVGGTATDNLGVAGVKVRLSRKRNGANEYWNGTDFVKASSTVDATVATPGKKITSWVIGSKVPPASKLDSGLYQVEAYALDASGSKSAVAVRPFTLGTDFIAPNVSIATPVANSRVSINAFSASVIKGKAVDNVGVTSVKLRVQRKRGTTTYYWNGITFTSTPSVIEASVTPQGGKSVDWSLNTAIPANQLDIGTYTVTAYGYDAASNSNSSAIRSFNVVDSGTSGNLN